MATAPVAERNLTKTAILVAAMQRRYVSFFA